MARAEAADAVASENFEGAMEALSKLRAPVDRFFDDILVNAEDATLRMNRLQLLAEIRDATHVVADFSKVAVARIENLGLIILRYPIPIEVGYLG